MNFNSLYPTRMQTLTPRSQKHKVHAHTIALRAPDPVGAHPNASPEYEFEDWMTHHNGLYRHQQNRVVVQTADQTVGLLIDVRT